MDWLDICQPFVEAKEVFRAKAYPDPEPDGIRWTVGFGATGPDIDEHTVWTREQARADLRQRLIALNTTVTIAVRVRLTAHMRAALVSLAYNIGTGALLTSTLLRNLNAGDYVGALLQFIRWDKDDGAEKRGLRLRRIDEARMFATGFDLDPARMAA